MTPTLKKHGLSAHGRRFDRGTNRMIGREVMFFSLGREFVGAGAADAEDIIKGGLITTARK
jgi:hypothetical protein